jgi:hypothetical protein
MTSLMLICQEESDPVDCIDCPAALMCQVTFGHDIAAALPMMDETAVVAPIQVV